MFDELGDCAMDHASFTHVDTIADRFSTNAAATRSRFFVRTRFLVPDTARSDRERLALACLRLVLRACEEADAAHYAQAHELAERLFERRRAVDYVRTVSAIVRVLRRDRETGFCFQHEASDKLTLDEDRFLLALQAAIDGNPVGVEAAAVMLLQGACGCAIADEFRHLAKLTLGGPAPCTRPS